METWQKENVSLIEYNIYRRIESLNIVNIPPFISYDYVTNILTLKK